MGGRIYESLHERIFVVFCSPTKVGAVKGAGKTVIVDFHFLRPIPRR